MEFNKVINQRRSIRNFKETTINKEVIQEILEVALKSPSAHNRQPWEFKVFTEKKKNELCELIQEKLNNKENLTYEEKIMRKDLLFMNQAPVIILINCPLDSINDMDLLSLGACIEHICLAATDKNLGSLWLGVINPFEKEIYDKFNFKGKLISGVVIGIANEQPKKINKKTFQDTTKLI